MKMLMEMSPPQDGRVVGDDDDDDFLSGREIPSAELLRRRAKVLLPKFRLETVALRPESLLLIFSRSKSIIYQNMGTRGGPRRPQPTRAPMGALACPGGLCPPSGPLW